VAVTVTGCALSRFAGARGGVGPAASRGVLAEPPVGTVAAERLWGARRLGPVIDRPAALRSFADGRAGDVAAESLDEELSAGRARAGASATA